MKKNQDNPQKVFERLNSLVNLSLGAVNTIAGRTLYDACEIVQWRQCVGGNLFDTPKYIVNYP